MRFRELHIEHFGIFSDRRIQFSPAGIQLIYGPNESGKTTLQTILREVLFGIEERSPYAFSPGDLAANVKLETEDGKILDYRRRKGRTKVVQGTITPGGMLDEEGLKRTLGGIDGALYRAIFAVNQADLTEGEEALKGGAREKLYSGGMFGALDPKVSLAAFGAERDLLFKLTGRSGSLLALEKEIRELEKTAREKVTRPAAYAELQKTLREKEALFEQLETKYVQVQTELLRKKRLLAALPESIRRKQLLLELNPLARATGFPLELHDELKGLQSSLLDAAEQHGAKRQEGDSLREKLARLTVNAALLAARVGIESCRKRAGAMEKNEIDIVKRETEARDLQLRIDKALAARPDWNQEKLKAFAFEGKLRSEFEALKRLFGEGETQRLRLEGRISSAKRQRGEAAAGLDAMKNVVERPDLEALLDGHADGLAREIGTLQDELRDKEAESAKAFQHLRPWCAASADATVGLSVPRRELVEAAQTQKADILQQRKEVDATRTRLEGDIRLVQRNLTALPAQGSIPSPDDLLRSRDERQAGWSWIRKIYIERSAAPDAAREWSAATPLPEAYERAVAGSDQTSDQMFSQAEEVSKREHLRLELARLQSELNDAAAAGARLAQRDAEWLIEWKALWAASGLDPGTPEEMLRWYEGYRLLGSLQVDCRRAAQKLEARTAEQDRFAHQLRLAMGAAETPIPQLLQTARLLVKTAREQNGARKALREQWTKADVELTGLGEEEHRLQEGAAAWRGRWQDLLGAWGFAGEWTVEALAQETADLVALQADLLRADDFRYRAHTMKEELVAFETDVRAVLATAAPDLLVFRPLDSIEPAAKRLEEEALRETERGLQEAHLKRLQDELVRLEAAMASKTHRRQEILRLGNVDSPEAFEAAAAQSLRVAKLEEEIRQADRLLAVHRENDPPDSFEAWLAAATSEELRAEVERLQLALDEIKALRDTALEEKRSAVDGLRGVRVESEAAELYRRAESKKADLTEGAERWIVAAVAAKTLEDAITRFERENQPRIIQEAGKIFAAMTDGAYDTLARRDNAGTLVVSGKGTKEKTPDQLSTGTREQLYLALRLAYAVDYCQENEPLPLLLDDVLVNFDDQRRANTLQAINLVAGKIQVIFLTCHATVADHVEAVCVVQRIVLGDGLRV